MARKSRNHIVSQNSDIVKNSIYKTAVYARLSAEKDESIARGTIDNQVNYIKNYVMQQSDMELYDVYVDDEATGTNYERPEFERMMTDIKRKKVNAIVVKDLSRLGRDYLDTGELLEIVFPRLNVRVVSINDNLDTINGQPDLMVAITNIVNDYYAKDISKKIYTTMQYKKEKGIPIGTLPYGYKSGRNADGDRIMLIDDEPAEVIRLIFSLYISGKGKKEIANILNEKGYLSPYCYMYSKYTEKIAAKPHLKWTMDNVGNILVNDVYIGVHKTGMTEAALFRNQRETKKPKSEWKIFENHHPPIISKDDFMKAAAIKASKTQKNTKRTQDNFLRGKIFCGNCGMSMTLYKNDERGTYYVCVRKKQYGKSVCNGRNSRKDYVYKIVFDVIKEQMEYLLEED
ncbi:MAG: recombinase family protein, partial [Firmicutes bacterium]|nr:recombinase family protein [Bacillota bacterium]